MQTKENNNYGSTKSVDQSSPLFTAVRRETVVIPGLTLRGVPKFIYLTRTSLFAKDTDYETLEKKVIYSQVPYSSLEVIRKL